jgi:hypothetical protein
MSEDMAKTTISPEALKALGGIPVKAPAIKETFNASVVRYLGKGEDGDRPLHRFSHGNGKIAPASMLIKIPLTPGTPNLPKGREIIVNGKLYRISGSHSRGRITVKKI